MATKPKGVRVSVRYVGMFDAVEVRLPDALAEFEGERATVKHGDSFETTAEQAASLLEQTGNWQKAGAKKGVSGDGR